MFGQDRDSLRRFYLDAWQKHRSGAPLQPLERLVATVVAQHPEYHALLDDPERTLGSDFDPANGGSNPFLHMGMHITLAEQLGSDRPTGIRTLYQGIAAASDDPHQAEHRMMECLGQVLWQAQRNGTMPDEQAYLACLQELLDRPRAK